MGLWAACGRKDMTGSETFNVDTRSDFSKPLRAVGSRDAGQQCGVGDPGLAPRYHGRQEAAGGEAEAVGTGPCPEPSEDRKQGLCVLRMPRVPAGVGGRHRGTEASHREALAVARSTGTVCGRATRDVV